MTPAIGVLDGFQDVARGMAAWESYEGYFPQVLEAIEAWLAGAPIRRRAASPNSIPSVSKLP